MILLVVTKNSPRTSLFPVPALTMTVVFGLISLGETSPVEFAAETPTAPVRYYSTEEMLTS